MGRITIVWITTQFVAFHRWKDAPDEVAFLRDYHRHIFKVKLGVEVTHNDRDVEFFILKDTVRRFIHNLYEDQYFDKSCEMIAEELLDHFDATTCAVSEDGENGATVYEQ